MFTVIVTEKGGDQKRLEFDKPEITIGRVQGNDIILPKGNVSKRHSRIVLKDGKFIIVDLKSTNGTYVNGRKITSPLVIKDSDKIYIGDFIITVEEPNGASAGLAAPASAPPLPAAPPRDLAPPPPPRKSAPLPPPPAMGDEDLPPAPSAGLDEPRPVRQTGAQASLPPPPPPRSTMPPPAMAPRDALAARAVAVGAPPTPPVPAARATGAQPALDGPPVPPARATGAQPALDGPPPAKRTAAMGAVPPPAAAPARLVGAGAPAVAEPGSGAAPMPVPPVSPAATPPPVVAPPPAIAPAAARDGAAAAAAAPLAPTPAPAPTPLDPKKLKVLELQREIHDRLAQQLELARLPIERLAEESLWQRAESVIVELVEQMDGAGQIPSFIDQDALIKDTLNETLGLGPLEDLLADDAVTAIFVNRHDRVLMERAGRSEHCDKIFSSELALKQVIDRLVAPIGRKAEGILDVRLPDGARLTAVLPPLATRGPTLALRKPRQGVVSVDDLVKAGVLSKAMADFLAVCTAARRNVVVCGGAGAAKAPLLSALAAACPPHERVVSVEETAELTLGRDAWIALEGSVADAEGKGGVGVAQLLAAARQLKPDRLVVGEVAGVEAWDLLLAMASACDGAFCAVAGEGPRAALASLETMARLGAGGATTRGVRELVAAGAHVIVHVARYADGAQRVTGISEVAGLRGDDFEIRDLFQFQPQGRGPDGVIRGRFVGLGNVPRFYDALEARGISADPSIFKA